jgi:hypothetical protein
MTSKLTSFGHKRSSSAEQDCIPVDDYEATLAVHAILAHSQSVKVLIFKYAARWWC